LTVKEAIDRSAVLFPSDTSPEKACIFLSELESRINTELFGRENVVISVSDEQTELSANGAYAQIYPLYIAARHELISGDADRYSFINSVFEMAYSDYANYVNRTKKPTQSVYISCI
jgi:hypothetical protein